MKRRAMLFGLGGLALCALIGACGGSSADEPAVRGAQSRGDFTITVCTEVPVTGECASPVTPLRPAAGDEGVRAQYNVPARTDLYLLVHTTHPGFMINWLHWWAAGISSMGTEYVNNPDSKDPKSPYAWVKIQAGLVPSDVVVVAMQAQPISRYSSASWVDEDAPIRLVVQP